MIEEVVSVELPVHERLVVRKNRLMNEENGIGMPRISIVTGTHGDELDGQYICYEVIRRIEREKNKLKGIVDIYPDINPLGLDTGSRGIPMFDLDMNRVFPGDNNGAMAEYVAAGIIEDIIGSDLCIDIHSSNIFVNEMPQVRINDDTQEKLLPYAKMMNAQFVWIYSSITVLDATLAYSLNHLGVPTLVTEMGVGNRITPKYCRDIVDGIFNLMSHMGIWDDEPKEVNEPIISTEGEVTFLTAKESGIFVSAVDSMGRTGNAAKSFKSPMKELNEQTVLIENAKTNKNDSYHQHTKYDDQVDRYYSTYDIGTLLHNNESYLEGTIDSKYDVDYYSFSYPQKSFYSKMGISSEITISLESKNSQAYNLVLYDLYGNQIGIATDDGHGNKQLTVPNWDCVTSDYVIRVENSNMTSDSGEGSYRIKITETKNRDTSSSNVQHSQEIANADNSEEKNAIKQKYEKTYQSEIDKLHQMQFEALPEDEKYSGTDSVEELLNKMKKGEQLSVSEMAYVKIFANLSDYERAEKSNYIKNDFYAEIERIANEKGIELPDTSWKIEIDVSGTITINGDITEENKEQIKNMISENFADDMWEKYIQTADISNTQYRLVNAYYEVEQFIQKATNGQYSFDDINVDDNGKITGLPEKMCKIMNSQEANAKYEEIRDNIYMLTDYKNQYGLEDILAFKAGYNISDSEVSTVGTSGNNSVMDNAGYYKNMKTII